MSFSSMPVMEGELQSHKGSQGAPYGDICIQHGCSLDNMDH